MSSPNGDAFVYEMTPPPGLIRFKYQRDGQMHTFECDVIDAHGVLDEMRKVVESDAELAASVKNWVHQDTDHELTSSEAIAFACGVMAAMDQWKKKLPDSVKSVLFTDSTPLGAIDERTRPSTTASKESLQPENLSTGIEQQPSTTSESSTS